jgi:hypothetical protein
MTDTQTNTYSCTSTPKLPPTHTHTATRSMVTSILFQEKSQDQKLVTTVNVWFVVPIFVLIGTKFLIARYTPDA